MVERPGDYGIPVPVSGGPDELRIVGIVNQPPPLIQGGNYIANTSITNEMIEDLSGDKLRTGTINADEIIIATKDNNVRLDKDGLKIINSSDPAINMEFNANEENQRIAIFRKGAIYIEDGDESVLIDTDGISADGIVRGVLPGAINPIVNSSFEKTEGVVPPTDWIPDTAAEWNDVSDPQPKRVALSNCSVIGEDVQLTNPPTAIDVQDNEDGDLNYVGSWSLDSHGSHWGGSARKAERAIAMRAADNFSRSNGPLGSSWLNWLPTWPKNRCSIYNNYVRSDTGSSIVFGAMYNRLFTSAELDSSAVITRFRSNDWANTAFGIGRRYANQDGSYWTTSFWVGDGTMTLNNGNQSIKATGDLSLSNNTWYYMRLQYDHHLVTAYTSTDAANWTKRLSIIVPGVGDRTGKAGFFGNAFNGRQLLMDAFSVVSAYGQTQPYVDYTIPAGRRGVDIITKKGPNQGNIHVILDGEDVVGSPINLYESADDYQETVKHIKGLDPLTSHTLRLQQDYWVDPSTSNPEQSVIMLDRLLVSGEGYITMQNDLTATPDDWTFRHNTIQPGETGIISTFRSSTTGTGSWSPWTTNFEVVPLRRYIQVRENLTSYDGFANPTLVGFNLGYQSEGTPIISDWVVGGSGSANIVSSSATYKFGTKSFYCDNSGGATDAKAHQEVFVKPNTNYSLSLYYEAQALSAYGALIQVYKPEDNGGALLATVGPIIGTSQIWMRGVSGTFNTDDCTSVIIEVHVGKPGQTTSGEFWMDAPMLHEDGVVTPWSLSLYDWIQHAHTGGAGSQIDHGELADLNDPDDHPQYKTEAAYPIGSLYFNADTTSNPNSLLGFGTWALFGQGRVLVCPDGGSFGDLGDTGGAETVTLGITNLPSSNTGSGSSHNHSQNAHNHTQSSHTHAQNSHDHPQGTHQHAALIYSPNGKYLVLNGGSSHYNLSFGTTGTGANECKTNYQTCAAVGGRTAGNVAQTAFNVAQTATNNAESSHNHPLGGSDVGHANVQPWVAVSIWKRTA